MAKIGWRIIKEPQSLLARVLLGKYARDVSFLNCLVPSSAFHGWRSILAGREILRKGLSWMVGNGESIKVWSDLWLSFSSPTQPMGPQPFHSMSLKVSELLCPLTNNWDLDKIRHHLPQYEDTILQIKTSSVPSLDTLMWLLESSGSYSTKTGYGLGMLANRVQSDEDTSFNWLKNIWNINTSPKIKDFIWKEVRKAIPVSANLERRGMAPFVCKKCGAPEDDLHVFLKCLVAAEVWNLVPTRFSPSPSLSSMADMLTGVQGMIPLPPTGLTSPIWPWILWNLWKARNCLIFQNRAFTAHEIALKSITDAKEWSSALPQRSINAFPQEPAHVLLATRAPRPPPSFPSGILIAKVDAAWDAKSKSCGLGGIFSGENTPILPNLCESQNHVSSALMAEAIAVRLAVVTAV